MSNMNKLIAILLIASAINSVMAESEKVFKGTYIWGPEVHSFKPCNDKNDYWVSFDWAGVEMHEYYKGAMKDPYTPMYIEFRGQVLNEAVDGFAIDYAGLIRVSEVFKYTFKIPVECK